MLELSKQEVYLGVVEGRDLDREFFSLCCQGCVVFPKLLNF